MRQDWAYRVTVSDGKVFDGNLFYEGKFVRYMYAEKVAQRKIEQYKGSGALVNIFSRWDGTCMTFVA